MKVLKKLLIIIFFLIISATFSSDSLKKEDLEIYPDYFERKQFANINGCVIISEPISDETGTLFSCLVTEKDTVNFYVWNQDSLRSQYEKLIYIDSLKNHIDSLKKQIPCFNSEYKI